MAHYPPPRNEGEFLNIRQNTESEAISLKKFEEWSKNKIYRLKQFMMRRIKERFSSKKYPCARFAFCRFF